VLLTFADFRRLSANQPGIIERLGEPPGIEDTVFEPPRSRERAEPAGFD
jgi:hypothetical protein